MPRAADEDLSPVLRTDRPHHKLCRHCGIAQAGSTVWWVRHSGFRTGIALVFTLVFLATWVLMMVVWLPSPFNRGEDFAPYRDQVKIISSQMSFSDTEDGPKISVVGVLRNDSPLAWKQIQLEVQFTDSAGELIDVARDRGSHWGSTVAADDESGFRISTS